MRNHQEWLDSVREDPIDPDLPICDTHHHFWKNPNDSYLVEDFIRDIGEGHNITQTVFVECKSMYWQEGPLEMRPVGETESVELMTARYFQKPVSRPYVAAGIVGFVDFLMGKNIEPVLEAHIEAGKGRFRGVRRSAAWDDIKELRLGSNPPKGLLLDSKFRAGFSLLQKYDLSFETWIYHTQLMELLDLVVNFPDTPIIINHLGGLLGVSVSPYNKNPQESIRVWRDGIAELAACPNVYMKLGIGGLPLRSFGWHKRMSPPASTELAEVMAPHFHWCVEQFGVDRCMFESNFPVNKVAYSYTALWNAFKLMAKDYTLDERKALFHDTAVSVYRLPTDISEHD